MLEPELVRNARCGRRSHTHHTQTTQKQTQTYTNRHTDTQISVMREIQVSNWDVVGCKGRPWTTLLVCERVLYVFVRECEWDRLPRSPLFAYHPSHAVAVLLHTVLYLHVFWPLNCDDTHTHTHTHTQQQQQHRSKQICLCVVVRINLCTICVF